MICSNWGAENSADADTFADKQVGSSASRRLTFPYQTVAEGGTTNKKRADADNFADTFADGERRKGHYVECEGRGRSQS